MDKFAAVILTGGTAQRLGGVDKARLVIDGRTLLETALAAVDGAEQIVIVGPDTGVVSAHWPSVTFTTEDPPLGGPAAGLLAGRDALSNDHTLLVVLAVDMPGVSPATIARLIDARGDADGAFLHDPNGRRQLAGVLDVRRLDDVRPPDGAVSGLPIHRLLASLSLVEVTGDDAESRDVDNPEDLA